MTQWSKEEALSYIAGRTTINEKTGCHEWTGPMTKQGYGQLGVASLIEAFGIKGVHRLVVHLAHGFEFTSRNQQVMHRCGNRPCCNPDHLKVGTPLENMNDKRTREAISGAITGVSKQAPMGEDKARMVKTLLAAGVRLCVIARAMGVHWSTINNIRRGTRWKHVTI